MKYCITLLMVTTVSVQAEMRQWTFVDGGTQEAEFVSVINDEVVLRMPRGRQRRIPLATFSEEDRTYIELNSPPKIDFEFSKTSKARVYPASWNMANRPQGYYFTFKARVLRRIYSPYQHELTAEFFVIGKEVHGDKKILLSYQKENFRFSDDSNLGIELTSPTMELTRFPMGGEIRGDEYDGYLIAVSDSRGEIIAYKTTDENLLDHIENLRKVPNRKMFDDECNRCMPTRPRKFY